MAIQLKGDGTFSIEYEGPYQGVDVQHPETLISDKASPAMNNFMLRNAELRSRPRFVQQIQAPANIQILGLSSFRDSLGLYHVVMAAHGTPSELYNYNPATLPTPWDPLGSPDIGPNPISYRTFAEIFYYTNATAFGAGGTNPFVALWDGLTPAVVSTRTQFDASVTNSVAGIALADSPAVGGSLPGSPTLIGPLSLGAQYIGELNNQLILANVNVLDQGSGNVLSFPNLVWWSANGLPLQWDPLQNTSAGFNALLDTPDQITGLATLGVAGYLFRTNGITQFSPSGSAITPFQFNHMWASDHGIGNIYPWSISQYGPQAAFISQDNLYDLTLTNARPIGGTARDAIFADLANVTPGQNPMAVIAPIFKNGYSYLTYQLSIPLLNKNTKVWVYSYEDKNWANWEIPVNLSVSPEKIILCPPNVV